MVYKEYLDLAEFAIRCHNSTLQKRKKNTNTCSLVPYKDLDSLIQFIYILLFDMSILIVYRNEKSRCLEKKKSWTITLNH